MRQNRDTYCDKRRKHHRMEIQIVMEKIGGQNRLPPGWDEERVQKVLKHYEEQTEDEAVAEDEAAP